MSLIRVDHPFQELISGTWTGVQRNVFRIAFLELIVEDSLNLTKLCTQQKQHAAILSLRELGGAIVLLRILKCCVFILGHI